MYRPTSHDILQVLNRYNATSYIKHWQGGQKDVFLVSSPDGEKIVKIYSSNANSHRIDREIELHRKYADQGGIPKIYDEYKVNNFRVVEEEYVAGGSLDENKDKYLSDANKISVLIKYIIGILDPIWDNEISHRDLKPENILIDLSGKPMVIDFGIALDQNGSVLTQVGFQPNSLFFCSPEQYQARRNIVDCKTDYFSLGVLAYYLYFGFLPFGDNELLISNAFNRGDNHFIDESDFPLKTFCKKATRFNTYERVRNSKIMIGLLS